MTIVYFTSSDSFMDHDAKAAESAEIPIFGYLEGTYAALRHSGYSNEGAGIEIARFIDGAWQLEDGRRFSDWAVSVA